MSSLESPNATNRRFLVWIHHGVLLLMLATGSIVAAALLCDALLQWEYAASVLPGSTAGHVIGLASSTVLGLTAVWRLGTAWRNGRWTSTSGATFRWAIVVGVATAVIQACIQKVPFYPLSAAVVAAEGFGVYALGVLLAPHWTRRVPAKLSRTVDIIAFNLALLPVSAELLLRAWDALHPTPLLDRGQLEADVWLAKFRFEPGLLRYGFPCNKHGFYDSDPPTGERTGPLVVCIGDSFSAGVVPLPFHYTSVCEELVPGLEVYNVGVPGANPSHYLSLLKSEALPLRPEGMVIAFFVGNDLDMRTQVGHEAGGVRSWFDRNGSAVYTLFTRWRILRQEADLLGIEPHQVGEVGAASALTSSMTKTEMVSREPWLADPLLERPTFSEEKFMEIETRQALRVCRTPPPHSMVDHDLSLRMLDAIRQAAGPIPLVVMLIPDEFQVEDELWEAIVRREGNHDLFRFRAQEMLRGWLESRGIAHIDLLPILRAQTPFADGRRHCYHRFDTHFNARGNRIAGEALAEFLRKQLSKPRGLDSARPAGR